MPAPTPEYVAALDTTLWAVVVPSSRGAGQAYRVSVRSYDGGPARVVLHSTWRGGTQEGPLRAIAAVDLPAVIAALERARKYLAGTHR